MLHFFIITYYFQIIKIISTEFVPLSIVNDKKTKGELINE